jgi:molybdopterin synthase sulfur carrier subunit
VNVKVKTFADFRELLGPEVALSVPEGETVRGLLRVLGRRHAAFLPKVLGHDGQLRPYINILHNGRNVKSLDDLDTRLAEADVIAIFPPLAGG